jgi:hypothetical protein
VNQSGVEPPSPIRGRCRTKTGKVMGSADTPFLQVERRLTTPSEVMNSHRSTSPSSHMFWDFFRTEHSDAPDIKPKVTRSKSICVSNRHASELMQSFH